MAIELILPNLSYALIFPRKKGMNPDIQSEAFSTAPGRSRL